MSELRPGFKTWATPDRLARLLPDLRERQRVTHPLERRFRRGTHDSIAAYHRLLAEGQITEVQGCAQKVRQTPGGACVEVATPQGRVPIEAPIVINCTGPGTRLALDPLSDGFLRRGWLRLTEDGGGLRVGDGLSAGPEGLRYLAPTVTMIGDAVMAMPLYDLGTLRDEVARANAAS